MSSGSWFVDTNVIVYLFDSSDPEKQARARTLFAGPDVNRLVFSTQVLGEFYVTASRKLNMPAADIDTALTLLSRFPVHAIRHELVADAIDLSRRHQLSYWDALILTTAAAYGCTHVLTEDLTAGQVLRGVEIANPFA